MGHEFQKLIVIMQVVPSHSVSFVDMCNSSDTHIVHCLYTPADIVDKQSANMRSVFLVSRSEWISRYCICKCGRVPKDVYHKLSPRQVFTMWTSKNTSKLDILKSIISSNTSESVLSDKISEASFVFYCQICQNIISAPRSFEKVGSPTISLLPPLV